MQCVFFLWWRSMPTRLLALCLIAVGLGACAPARAACSSQGCVTAGPRLASVDSNQGELLNLITGSLLGSSVSLTVADWNALAGGNIKLASLLQALQLQLGVSSPSTALSANATVAQILNAAATAAQADGQTLAASALGRSAAQVGPLGGVVRLGDLLDIRLPDNALATASIDALELLSGTAQLYNTRNVLTTPTPVGVPGITVGLLGLSAGTVQLLAQAVEPPVYVCGPAGTQFHTATIRLKLNINLASLNLDESILNGLEGVLGANLQLGQLQVFIEVARAEGAIGMVNALGTALTVEATPGVADIYLGNMPDSVFFERSRKIVPSDLGYGVVAALTTTILFNTQTVAINARARARGQTPGVRSLSFSGPFPQTRTASTSLGFVATLLSDLVGNLELQIQPSLGALVDAVLLAPLKGLVTGVVSPLLNGVLTNLGDPLLQSLGVRLGEVDVTVGGAARLCDLSGHVYNDANHNAGRDGGEGGCGQLLYAKVLSPTAPSGSALAVAPVNAATGAYAFGPVASGSYQVVVNGSSAAADVTPAAPPGWLGTEVPTLSRAVNLATDVPPLNFGLFNGSSVSGSVFADTGAGGGTANDGTQQGAEAALANVTLRALTAGNAVLDTTASVSNGAFTVWIPASADGGVVRVVETNPGSHVSVAGQAGTLAAAGGVYDRVQDAIGFTPVAGTRYTGVVFADVPENRLTGDGQQAVLAGATATHAHRFTAGTSGQLALAAASSPAPGWPVALFRDTNCNALLDAGDLPLTAPLAVVAEQTLCLLARVSTPAGASVNDTQTATLTATFTYTNAGFSSEQGRADITVIGPGTAAGLKLTKTVDKTTAASGDTLVYVIRFENQGKEPLGNLRVSDQTPAYTVFAGASCGTPLPAGLSACSVSQQPAPGATGGVEWSLTGNLPPGGSGQVGFSVTVE